MLKEIVEVVDRAESEVKIKFTRKPMCACCKFSSFCAKGEDVLNIKNMGFFLERGDKIEVGIEEKLTVLAALITFFVPTIFFVFLLILLKNYGEFKSFLAALFFLVIYYLVIKLLFKRKAQSFELKILRKL